MEKHRKVSGLISGSEAKCNVIEFVAGVCMMRNPVRSRFGSSSAPSPHRNELPSAENSVSENTSPTVEKALMLKSPPMKSTLRCFM